MEVLVAQEVKFRSLCKEMLSSVEINNCEG